MTDLNEILNDLKELNIVAEKLKKEMKKENNKKSNLNISSLDDISSLPDDFICYLYTILSSEMIKRVEQKTEKEE